VIVLHWLGAYLAWTGSNVGAMPLEALAATAAGLVFRKPIMRLWRWFSRELRSESRQALAEIRETAEAARRIAADTHRHVTGQEHPDAPKGRA
jgi:hypothetical protein